mgnify:FL=1
MQSTADLTTTPASWLRRLMNFPMEQSTDGRYLAKPTKNLANHAAKQGKPGTTPKGEKSKTDNHGVQKRKRMRRNSLDFRIIFLTIKRIKYLFESSFIIL